MFLTYEDLVDLTGYKYKSLQKRWLVEAGYKFSVRRDGFPCVLISHIERILGGTATQRQHQQQGDANALLSLING